MKNGVGGDGGEQRVVVVLVIVLGPPRIGVSLHMTTFLFII